MNTRRKFLIQAPLAALVGTTTWKQALTAQTPSPTPTTAGAPPTFGTGPGSGPPVTTQTFAEAEKRSEEHTSELQSRVDLVCRLLLEKKKKNKKNDHTKENTYYI